MSKRVREIIRRVTLIILILGLIIGCFYVGVIFGKGNETGFPNLFKEQGINVLFGILGGLITTALITYLQNITKEYRYLSKEDRILTDTWDEGYIPEDFPENGQEQILTFRLKQTGERITGHLIGEDSPTCPPEKKHGYRRFNIEGRKEGDLISLIAIIDDDREIGHTVYLLQLNHNASIMEGETTYYDLNERALASAHSKLIRRRRIN
ncbi:hypothetical protein IDJ77_11515 [Mucilaginibacter sp. ZT4R22]|uniref:SMODS-associating 2TM beta-strand rich effector domain-containing protein n=1 Tax=Mucilaginibacter pankratovii TaxID=2772110 RepID=A0ABR7WQ56_9SPHI|nr:hypothetical protein [Mucilaginibacter pankratovii]MBD1364437.1 hypothetical protein [Mucilaginibacter pankratovii]